MWYHNVMTSYLARQSTFGSFCFREKPHEIRELFREILFFREKSHEFREVFREKNKPFSREVSRKKLYSSAYRSKSTSKFEFARRLWHKWLGNTDLDRAAESE